MNTEYRFITGEVLRDGDWDPASDPDGILQGGVGLYREAILEHPDFDENNPAVAVATLDGKIAGRFMLLHTRLKAGDRILPVLTGGGLLVGERFRGLGVGYTLTNTVLDKQTFFGALFTRAAWNIFRKRETMLQIPQFVRFRDWKKHPLASLRLKIKLHSLYSRFIVKRMILVPDWAARMIAGDGHKYREIHTTAWLQWALDHTVTGNPADYQAFYAVFDKKARPAGFFMTKVRHLQDGNEAFVKANLVEWATDCPGLDEAGINLLAADSYEAAVSRCWTISENEETAAALKRYGFERKGWFAISIGKHEVLEDAGDAALWRIRYGCCNTALVE